MNRCFLFVCLFAAILLSALGWFWLQQPPSNQELLANTAKALDYAEGWKGVGGPPWWTPNFLQGSSLAPHLTTLGSMLPLLVATKMAGLFSGPKIAALCLTFLAVIGVYAWVRRLTAEPLAGAAAAVVFLLGAPLYLRLVHVEHMVFVAAFAVIPFVLLRLTILVETPTRRNGLLFGAVYAVLLLTYGKAAFLLLPLAILYGAVLWLWKQRTWRLPFDAILVSFLAVVILGVLPSLPAVREMRLVTLFELAPFQAWQSVFSLKSSILWFDRDGLLTQGMAPGFLAPSSFGGNYLGLIPLLLVGIVLIARPRDLQESSTGFALRLLLGLALTAHWFSFGPRPILLGQLEYLKLAFDAPDFTIALSWFLLVVQGWIIFRLLPPRLPGRLVIGGVIVAIYLFVPGFRFLGWLPFYTDLRAPHDFSQIAGFFFFAAAAGCALRILATRVSSPVIKGSVAAALCVMAVADVTPYWRKFVVGPMDRQVFTDFEAAARFLATAPKEGRVFPLSGRYFYLLIPHLSQRGLTSEAFNSYLMTRGMNFLQATAQSMPGFLRPYLNLGGVSYVFIDKTDPDSGPEIQARFRDLLKPVFENDNFVILENPTSLGAGFVARNFISGNADFPYLARAGLSLESQAVVVLPEKSGTIGSGDGRVGTMGPEEPVLDKTLTPETKQDFLPLALAQPRNQNYQEIALSTPRSPGWAVFPEAFHPDWTAHSESRSLPVVAADGAFLAVGIDNPQAPITLKFSPPWWYNGVLALSAVGWLGLGGLLILLRLPLPARSLRQWLDTQTDLDQSPHVQVSVDRPPIARPVVVIPTYNEARSLPRTLEKVFAAHDTVEVLVVDDGSPDGTADVVRNHPAFGTRLHLLPRPGKLGLGSAYREGFHWAFERNYDACLEMDADLSHDPADIPRLISTLDEGVDAAIGSRYLGGVRVMNWPENRLFLSTGASRFVRLVTGLPLTDATSGFKALRVSVLRALDWKKFRAEGYGFQVELHHALWQLGARLVEVPIVFTERRDGETKMTLGIAIEAAVRTIRLALEKK
jgi:dolichol-phosphate mannosyltransferase